MAMDWFRVLFLVKYFFPTLLNPVYRQASAQSQESRLHQQKPSELVS